MMLWNDTSGEAQEQYIPQYYQTSQSPSVSHAVVGPWRDHRVKTTDRRRFEYLTASSSFRTARSASVPMPPKRTSSGSPSGTPVKLPKTELKPEDFSNSVKKRLQSSTRTGQACDRCKVRKIRCDGLPGGCSPCLQNNTECRTTDRITGRAAPRGYVDNIEQQNREMANRIRELENQLMQHGIEVKPATLYHDTSIPAYTFNSPAQNGHTQLWNAPAQSNSFDSPATSGGISSSTQQETNMFRALPAFRSGCTGDNYLGVSSGNSHLSSIKGTALSILGMEIDIADFTSQDMDEPDQSLFAGQLYNKSYQAFLQSALNVNPKLDKVKLPGRDEGMTYAEWFFRVVNPFMPILHKGTFMALLARTYDDPNFRPTTAQTVMVHMVFAIMFFQYAVRNWEDATQQAYLNNQSNLHYHYSLSMFYNLVCSHTLQDVQALTLICSHLRNFPKPGASWILTMITLSLAVELGLHRSAKRWAADQATNPLDIEMRKRVFWSVLCIHLTLSGKLGRPMALRPEDFDVEIPEPIDDSLISETGIDTSRSVKCSHHMGIIAFRIGPLFMEMYSTIYAVRRTPETYIETVNSLEAKLRVWSDNLPAELSKVDPNSTEPEGRVFALYTQAILLEFKLLLRHPSVSMTLDANFNAESMRICVECAREMLVVVQQLQKFKSLDTTWYNTSVYVMAITTTLFAQWEKRNETTTADLAGLRAEMDCWLDIMTDMGALLGSGMRLREAVRVVTDGTLGLLSKNLQNKSTSYIPTSSGQDVSAKSPHQRPISNNSHSNGYGSQSYSASYSDSNQQSNINGTSTSYLPSENPIPHHQTPYPAATQYSSYPDPSANSSSLSYQTQESNAFSTYPNTSDSVEAPLLAAFAAQASQVQPNTWQRPQSHGGITNSGSQSWQQWTSTMAGNLEPQDCYSANALMQLGGRDLGVADGAATNVSTAADMAAHAGVIGPDAGNMGGQTFGGVGTGAWPLNVFDIGSGGTGG